jgi:LysM repeat protein
MNGLGSKQSMIRSGQTLNVPGGIDRTHVVRRGETLGRIASRYGIRLADLLDFNTLSLHSIIRPGQVLRIP